MFISWKKNNSESDFNYILPSFLLLLLLLLSSSSQLLYGVLFSEKLVQLVILTIKSSSYLCTKVVYLSFLSLLTGLWNGTRMCSSLESAVVMRPHVKEHTVLRYHALRLAAAFSHMKTTRSTSLWWIQTLKLFTSTRWLFHWVL